MFRYENFANIGISTDLHNGYSVVGLALWDKETENYSVDYFIKDNQINNMDLMEDHSSIPVISDAREIRNKMNEYINENFTTGKFDYYIQRYKYEKECFDYGDDLLGGMTNE